MPFRKPEESKLGGKFLAYGKKGTSKTTFLLSFPRVAIIDAEAGASFYEGTEKGENIVLVSNSQSFKDFEDDLDEIQDNFEEEGIATFGLDSATKIKENLEETIMTIDEKREKKKGKSADETNLSIRSRGRIKYVSKRLQNLKIDLSTKGVNIVDIAQCKEIKEKQGDQFVTVGYEPDMQKNADHDYDVVLRTFTEKDPGGKVHYKAEVEKDRLGVFKQGEVIENPTYDLWKAVLEKRQKGKALNTSFVQQIDDAKEQYEEEADLDEKSWKEKIKALNEKLSDEEKQAFLGEIKEAKITGFDNLTPIKEQRLKEIYETHKK